MMKELVHDVAKQLFHEVIDEMCTQLGAATVNARRCFMLQTECVCNELIGDFVSRLIRFASIFLSISTSFPSFNALVLFLGDAEGVQPEKNSRGTLCRDYNCNSTTIRLPSDYDISYVHPSNST